MRRLFFAALIAVFGFALTAAPAQATVPPHPYDILQTRVTSTSTASGFWRAGNANIDACELWITNKRSERHAIRVEVVRRDINAVIYSVVKTLDPGEQGIWDMQLAYEPFSTGLYMRFRWGDDPAPYSYGVLDPFNQGSTSLSFKPIGTWSTC